MKRMAQVKLKGFDVLGNCGLGQVQLHGGIGEAEVSRSGLEGAQPDERRQIELHEPHPTYA